MSSTFVLAGIEARKVLDTRAGRALVVSSLVVMTLMATIAAIDQRDVIISAVDVKVAALSFATITAPFVAIMIFTVEWSTRSVVQLFVLEPRRGRVAAAKVAAAIGFAAGTVLLVTALSIVIAALVAGSAGTRISLQGLWWLGEGLTSDLLRVTLYTLLGVAIGSLTRSTAVAVTAFLLLTLLADPLTRLAPMAVSRWLSLDSSIAAISTLNFALTRPSEAVVGAAVWLVFPGILGLSLHYAREAK